MREINRFMDEMANKSLTQIPILLTYYLYTQFVQLLYADKIVLGFGRRKMGYQVVQSVGCSLSSFTSLIDFKNDSIN